MSTRLFVKKHHVVKIITHVKCSIETVQSSYGYKNIHNIVTKCSLEIKLYINYTMEKSLSNISPKCQLSRDTLQCMPSIIDMYTSIILTGKNIIKSSVCPVLSYHFFHSGNTSGPAVRCVCVCVNVCVRRAGHLRYFLIFFNNKKLFFWIFCQVSLTGSGLFK